MPYSKISRLSFICVVYGGPPKHCHVTCSPNEKFNLFPYITLSRDHVGDSEHRSNVFGTRAQNTSNDVTYRAFFTGYFKNLGERLIVGAKVSCIQGMWYSFRFRISGGIKIKLLISSPEQIDVYTIWKLSIKYIARVFLVV